MQPVSMKRDWLPLTLAVLVGGFARFLHLGARSLWLDDAISLEIARLDGHNLLAVVTGREVNMSLYYLLLHIWIRLGVNEFTLRAPSAIFGTLAIVFIYLLASDWLDQRTAVFAAWLAALNPAFVACSQEGRSYTLAILLAIASFLLFRRALNFGLWKHWLSWAMVTACGFYSHLFFVWLLLVQSVFLLAVVPDGRTWKRALAGCGICGMLLLPLVWIVFTTSNTQLSWISAPVSKDLLRFFLDSAGAGGGLLAGLYVLFAAVGLYVLYFQRESMGILLILWWLLPVAVTFVVSFRVPIFVPRYLLICVAPMLVLAAEGLSSAKSIMVQRIGLMVVLAASGYGTHLYLRSVADSSRTNDWRGASAYMSQVLRDGDLVLFYYGAERLPFDFYLRQHPTQAHFTVYPDRSSVDLLLGTPPGDDPSLLALAGRYQRVFVLSEFQPNQRWRRVINGLNSRCSRTDKSTYFGFVRIDQLDCFESP